MSAYVRASRASSTRSGLKTRTFASAEEYLRFNSSAAVRCLILDMRLPRHERARAAATIARPGSGVPTIFVTADADGDGRLRAKWRKRERWLFCTSPLTPTSSRGSCRGRSLLNRQLKFDCVASPGKGVGAKLKLTGSPTNLPLAYGSQRCASVHSRGPYGHYAVRFGSLLDRLQGGYPCTLARPVSTVLRTPCAVGLEPSMPQDACPSATRPGARARLSL